MWMGTFVANGQGTTGMLYRRNRYFNPGSGQFTQADPIGIAGGMNAFGFAGGDPVNYGDSFGLYGCPNDDIWCLLAKAGWEGLGGILGLLGGGAGGFVASAPCLEICAPVAMPAAAAAGGVAGVHIAGRIFDDIVESRASGSGPQSGSQPEYKTPVSGATGKEAARDVPSWAKGNRPRIGESGKDFAKRMMDEQYGAGEWEGTGPRSEFSKIKKWGDRGFVEPKQ
jgi:RHS repeat-associated protein